MNKILINIIICFLPIILCCNNLSAQNVPSDYKKFFVKYDDNRSIVEKTLNVAGLTNEDIGRSFAFICGVSYYPNMGVLDQELDAVNYDIAMLQEYLEEYEFFDEIVVLKNSAVTDENIKYFLQSYFPERLKKFPKSRFLFAYSGHGMTQNNNGYLLKNTARNLTDKNNSINLRVLKVYMDEVVSSGYQVLVLLNSCYSGAFLKRSQGGHPIPKHSGAHAITAGGSGELAWHDPELGNGSVFYEKLIAGLGGIADVEPNGIITTHELATYLRNEIQVFTDQHQNPQFGDISLNGSLGEFFFLNRGKQIAQNNLPEIKMDNRTSMGISADILYNQGLEKYKAKDYTSAFSLFKQSADLGSSKAMTYLGYQYNYGLGCTENFDKAEEWYLKGAEAGEVLAMSRLGNLYMFGVKKGDKLELIPISGFKPIDINETIRWYRKAANLGDSRALFEISSMYYNGNYVAKDFKEAVFWLRKGAETGSDFAMYKLGEIYSEGGYGIKKDFNEAKKWFREASEAGNSSALRRLKELGDD